MNRALFLAALVVCGGCSSTTASPSDAGTPPADHGDPPPPPEPVDCAAGDVARFAGQVTALSDRAPIANARVCVLEHEEIDCVTTDAAGSYALDCAPRGDAAISFEATGFAPAVWLWAGPPSGDAYESLDVSLSTDAENRAYFEPTGVGYPDGASSLVTIVPRGNVFGMTARLRSGTGQGAFYTVYESGAIDPLIEFITAENELAFFVAQPWNGWHELEVELVPRSGSCAQLGGAWPARDGAANVVRVPVRPGTESVIWVRCE